MHDRLFSSRAKGKAVVGDYIETYYNQQRLHQTLGYQTPAAVEAVLYVPNDYAEYPDHSGLTFGHSLSFAQFTHALGVRSDIFEIAHQCSSTHPSFSRISDEMSGLGAHRYLESKSGWNANLSQKS